MRSGNRPGRGGVNRGRGDADMTWGDESDKANTKFKEVVLSKGTLDKPKDEVIGVTANTPDVDVAESAPSAGKDTWNRKVRPRHRNAVRKYFDSKPDKSADSK